MWRYFDLLSFKSDEDIRVLKNEVLTGRNPMEAKFLLAKEIVTRFHNSAAAEQAHAAFVHRFSRGILPENIEEKTVAIENDSIPLSVLMKQVGLVSSASDALRMIQQGAVKINEQRVSDERLNISKGFLEIIQVGKKRIAKVRVV